LNVEYYSQRCHTPGTLIITEATAVSYQAQGQDNAPGIYTEAQVEGWKKVTRAVHDKGCFIYCQLWAMGRAGDPATHARHGLDLVSASAIPFGDRETPRALRTEEVKEFVQSFTDAAKNAIRAGFDGVEIHSANGYLLDSFLQDVSNTRTDQYGGSVENRTRFPREVIQSVSAAIGESRTAIRLSPWSYFQGMRMTDPITTFSYLISAIADTHPNLAYLSMIEPRIYGWLDNPDTYSESMTDSNDFARKIWSPRPYVTGGGYSTDMESAVKAASQPGVIVAYGRSFIANPDLVERIRNGIPFNPYDRNTFYVLGPKAVKGYTDYPFAEENQSSGHATAHL